MDPVPCENKTLEAAHGWACVGSTALHVACSASVQDDPLAAMIILGSSV